MRQSKPKPPPAKPAAAKEIPFPVGKPVVSHPLKPGWLGYIYQIPWGLEGIAADVVWLRSPIDPITEKPYPLPINPQRYSLSSLSEQAAPALSNVVGDTLTQEAPFKPQKSGGLKTIIAGSRTIKSLEIVEEAIAQSGFEISEVVSGTASGVDKLGEQWAAKRGLPCRQFPADWETHGKKAGWLRNAEMAGYADALIAVWDGESKGTANMITEAQGRGLKVFIFRTRNQLSVTDVQQHNYQGLAAQLPETNSTITGIQQHNCHAIGCQVEVEPKLLMCRRHWSMVPKALQAEVLRLYRPGQETDKIPTAEYLKAARDAIAWVDCKEHPPDLLTLEDGLVHVINRSWIKKEQKLPNVIVAMYTAGHPLGNPWYKEASTNRAGCIAKFRRYLWEQYQIEGSKVRLAVDAIAALVLQGEHVYLTCCCKPLDCHCDEIKRLLDKIVIPKFLEVAA